MNDTSRILVTAANEAVMKHHLKVDRPMTINEVGAVTTAAVLRQLAVLMNTAEIEEISALSDESWPDASDLVALASDVESSL